MAGAYPELRAQAASVARVVRAEEERFGSTLKQAMARCSSKIGREAAQGAARRPSPAPTPSGSTTPTACPSTSSRSWPRTAACSVDHEGFERELEAQRERARQASKMGAVTGDPLYMGLLEKGKTEFLGYDGLVARGRARAGRAQGRRSSPRGSTRARRARSSSTARPSTASPGGQVGDHGVIAAEGSAAEVVRLRPARARPLRAPREGDRRRLRGGHDGARRRSTQSRRAGAMRHHTGTHLLHAALRETLGTARQAGGQPGGARPAALRLQPLRRASAPRELRHIENRVNEQILRNARRADEGHGPRGGARLRRPRLLRRQVRRAGARGRGARASPRSSAAAPTSTRPATSASSWSPPSRASPRARGGWRPSPARRPSSAPGRTRGSWRSWSRRPRPTGASLVDEYAQAARRSSRRSEREIERAEA